MLGSAVLHKIGPHREKDLKSSHDVSIFSVNQVFSNPDRHLRVYFALPVLYTRVAPEGLRPIAAPANNRPRRKKAGSNFFTIRNEVTHTN